MLIDRARSFRFAKEKRPRRRRRLVPDRAAHHVCARLMLNFVAADSPSCNQQIAYALFNQFSIGQVPIAPVVGSDEARRSPSMTPENADRRRRSELALAHRAVRIVECTILPYRECRGSFRKCRHFASAHPA